MLSQLESTNDMVRQMNSQVTSYGIGKNKQHGLKHTHAPYPAKACFLSVPCEYGKRRHKLYLVISSLTASSSPLSSSSSYIYNKISI